MSGKEYKGQDGLERYELFGWDYETLNPLSNKEIGWYLYWAKKAGGPVLELACGTGRLLCRLAEAGFRCTGIDKSPAMLALARRNRSRLKPDVRKRMSLKNADIRSVALKGKYGLAIIADNSFSVLSSKRQQKECLESVRRYLKPNGLILLTVRNHDKDILCRHISESDWSEPIYNPTTKQMVIRKVLTRFSKEKILGEYRYEVIDVYGRKKSRRFTFSNPIMGVPEYLSLLSDAGFKPRIYSDYRLRQPGADTRMLCLVAKKGRPVLRHHLWGRAGAGDGVLPDHEA